MTIKFGSTAPPRAILFWIENGTEHPQAVALITDVCHPKAYAASYGTWTCQGDTVAEVKEQLDKIGQSITL